MNIYSHQDKNVRRTWGLMFVFLVLVVAVGWVVSWFMETPAILYIAVIFAVLMNFFGYWYSDKLVIKLTRAKPVSQNSHRELWNVVENLSITAGLPMPKLYIVEDPSPNAFATGRNAENSAVAVTTGLLQILDKTELEGVIAHELSHIGNRDMLVSTVAVMLVGFIAILADFCWRIAFYGGGRRDSKGGGILLILAIVAIILAPIAAKIIQFAISRKREFLADASGVLLTRYPEGLASALEKISNYSRPMKHASHATAHLFISNPFGPPAQAGKQGFSGFMNKIFSSHPPVKERVSALREKSL
jgi:heat shock protein HtpX